MPLPIPAPRAAGLTARTAVPLYWARYGPAGAPSLLVLHGGPGAHHDYLLPQMLELARDHELLFYDQRGGGRSKIDDPAPITWNTHVADLAAVIDELLDGAAPSIVGYSWGGLLALLYTAHTPQNAPAPRRLALIDPAPVTRAHRDTFEQRLAERGRAPAVQRLRDELALSGLRERDPDAHRQRTFELAVAGYFADPARARDLTPFRVTGRVQQQVWTSLGEFDIVADLERAGRASPCPAIVVHGRDDPIPLASSEAVARALGAELVVLDGAGHVPYVEQPVPLFAALTRFLAATES